MRTELEKEYLRECYMDETAEGMLIDNLFKMPRYQSWKKRRELEGGQREMSQDFNEAMNNVNSPQGEMSAPQGMPANNPVSVPVNKDMQNPETIEQPMQQAPTQKSEFDALDNSGEVERKKFDPTPYIGMKSHIEFIDERKGQYGFYIRLYSGVVDEGDREIRATVIFGLEIGEDGRLGWSKDSKLYNFLKEHNVNHYKELLENPTMIEKVDDKKEKFRRISGIPKTSVIIQTNAGKDGTKYLTF